MLKDADNIPRKYRRKAKGEVEEDVLQFIASGDDINEIVQPEGQPTISVRNSYGQAVKRLGVPATVFQRKGRVYIQRDHA